MRGLGERRGGNGTGRWPADALARLFPAFLLQPLLDRIVRRMVARYPDILERMGEKAGSAILIDPTDAPFVLLLRPDPRGPEARICGRFDPPAHDASVSGTFRSLLQTIDSRADGDALFFSRSIRVGGDVEAAVRLRNAIDDVDGSIAADIAALHGPAGIALLRFLRRGEGEGPAARGGAQ